MDPADRVPTFKMPRPSRVFTFVVFIACIFSVGYVLKNHISKVDMSTKPLRVLMADDENPKDADPARILFNVSWGHLENLASPLVEWSSDGQIRSGAAKTFEWHRNELHLHMREDYRTVDGYSLTADDAAFSLKRLIVLARNTHGFIADFLCGDKELKSISDECPGIRVNGNTLILQTAKGKDFLLKMLAAMDFVVLLKKQVDPVTLSIKSYRNTTGPYRLEEDDAGRISYVANRSHWHYSEKMPQVAQLIPYDPRLKVRDPHSRPVFQLFSDDQADILLNFSSDRSDLYVEAAKSVPDASLVPTLDIARVIAVFTPRGVKDLSSQQRIAIGKSIREAVNSVIVNGNGGNKPIDQFFASFGDGALTDLQLKKLRNNFESTAPDNVGSGIRISLPGSMPHALKAIQSRIPEADCRLDMVDYIEGKSDGEPHVYVITTDTGWTEDLGLLSYTINMKQFFPLDSRAGQIWLNEYVDIEDKASRLERLRELHLRALSEPWIVPIASQEYFTLVRSPWQYTGPKLFNSGALWHLRQP